MIRLMAVAIYVLGLSTLGMAQSTEPANVQRKVYKQAIRYQDEATAILALHQLIALEVGQRNYKDTLLNLYFSSGRYLSSFRLADELLPQATADSIQLRLIEVQAISLRQLGATMRSLNAYEQLFARSGLARHGYELARLQHQAKRLAEAAATVKQALGVEETTPFSVQFSTQRGEAAQNVPLQAALHNLNGLIAFDLKDEAMAAKHFQAALEVKADFFTAQQNLAALKDDKAADVPAGDNK